ncbi:hypothetical protein QKW35_14580 [Pontibacterium granulatum]|uniref:hypothetical protein n=1 Tax=Pontibacterium granulatum TaxID=2036029 RepID=UPI00249B9305|nr:hypothetical protein [Pontibacterium granulatum]MDI3325601.1 hypothetical protein [Pontibacterium granulatum]
MTDSVQNMSIKENLAKANLAVNALHALGLTVTAINIDDSRPHISVNDGRGCLQLKPGITRFVTNDGIRTVQHEALIAECKVSWEERP